MKKLLLILIFLPLFSFPQQSYFPDEVKSLILKQKEKMNNVSNPITATYLGSELHDYFYFPFIGLDGKHYDFADGNNNLGDIPFGTDDAEINSQLIGKKFLIYWGWRLSSFHCCQGGMDLYKADLPSILRIEYYIE